MKLLLLSIILPVISGCEQKTVYICDSRTAYRYHLRGDCRGLNNCTHRIIKVSLQTATEKGRTRCRLEK